MKLKKLLFSFAIIILMLQGVVEITCNATEDKSQKVILNDFSEIEKNIEPVEEKNEDLLKIYSESAILIEAQTGKILYEKDIYARKYPASTTKILTAIIAIEKCDLNEKAIASHTAVFSVKSGYSIANIQEGESFTIRELLEVLMLQSANEAANIIAEHISGSVEEFANLMNQKAKEIGCLDSNFVNANGAHDENHYSTAYDLSLIAKYCMQNEIFRELAQQQECFLPSTEKFEEERIFINTNSLMQQNSRYYYPYCNGIKTGFTTPAKNCLISSSNKGGFELISVILHAECTEEGLSARYIDTINLFEYGYNNFKLDNILKEYNITGTIRNNSVNSNIKNNNSTENITKNEENSSNIGNSLREEEEAKYEILEDEKTIETVTSAVKKEYNSYERKSVSIGWIQIILGVIIFIVSLKYYLNKSLKTRTTLKRIKELENRKMKKDNLYNFKLG